MSTTIPFITIPQMQSNLGQVAPWDLIMLIQGTEHDRAAAIKLKDLSVKIGHLILWTGGAKLGDVQFIKTLTSGGYYYIANLRDDVVDTNHLKNGSVDWDILSDSAVTEAKIQRNAVTTDKIANGAVTQGKIANGAVIPEKIANGAVTIDKINTSAVTTEKIASKAVTAEKLNSDVINLILNSWTISHRWPSSGPDMNGTNFPFPRPLVRSKLRITVLTNTWSTTEELVVFTLGGGVKTISNLTSGWSSPVSFVRYIDIELNEASNLIGANYIQVGAKETAEGQQLDMNFTVQSMPSV